MHLYVVKNNRTDTEASIEDIDKEFLSSTDAFAIVSADEAGSPANDIKGMYIPHHISKEYTFMTY